MIRSSLRSYLSSSSLSKKSSQYRNRYLSSASIIEFSDADCSPESSTSNQHPLFPKTFTPLELSPHISPLSNRVMMGSMHCGLEPHSIPSFLTTTSPSHHLEALSEYYAERARGKVSLIITGGIAPNKTGWVGPFAAKLTNQSEVEQHKVVTQTVHAENDGNTKICMQILHTGRYAMHPFLVAPSPLKAPINHFTPFEMSPSLIQSTIKDYVNCAVLAKEAGYDGVEIMGSEGYLIHQFLSRKTNIRKDEWGGKDFSNRMKFAMEIVKQTKRAVGEDFIIVYRLSLLDLMDEVSGSDWEEVQIMALALQDAGIHILNTGIGWHEARVPTIATSVPRAAFVESTTQKLKRDKILNTPLVATNRINDPHLIEDILSREDAPDMVSMARPFLADPYIVKKMFDGETDEINTCIGCNQGCLDHIFVGRVASCLVNPKAGYELEMKKMEQRKRVKQNIAVIGAGPSGMAFSVAAAELGHHVTLMDSGEAIGGQFHMAKQIPGKEEFYETLRYFNTMITKKWKDSITLKLNTKVSADDLLSSDADFDKIIVATGVKPRLPPIPGIEHPNVVNYVQVLKEKVDIGNKIAIIGAGGIGFDVAEYLLHANDSSTPTDAVSPAKDVNPSDFFDYWGIDKTNSHRGGLKPNTGQSVKQQRDITLLQRKQGKLGANLGKTTGWIHRMQLKKGNVEMIGGCMYEKIDENGHLHLIISKIDKKTGRVQKEKKILEVDNIILCAGQESYYDLESELNHKQSQENKNDLTMIPKQIFRIGGAYQAGELDAKRAIDMGVRLAYDIDLKDPKVPDENTRVKGDEERIMDYFKKFLSH